LFVQGYRVSVVKRLFEKDLSSVLEAIVECGSTYERTGEDVGAVFARILTLGSYPWDQAQNDAIGDGESGLDGASILHEMFAMMKARKVATGQCIQPNLPTLLNLMSLFSRVPAESAIAGTVAEMVNLEGRRSNDPYVATKADGTRSGLAFTNLMLERMEGRKLFSTTCDISGAVFKSIAVGDELWLLAGFAVPVILRPLYGSTKFRFMGDAYAHGIMEGELMNERVESEFHTVKII
jgi:hypothetical protein